MQCSPVLTLTLTASGAVNKHHLVKYSGAQADTAGEKVVGVNTFNATDGQPIAVHSLGTAIVQINGPVTVGDPLTVDATGQGIKSTVGTDHVFGDALESGVATNKIEVRLR